MPSRVPMILVSCPKYGRGLHLAELGLGAKYYLGLSVPDTTKRATLLELGCCANRRHPAGTLEASSGGCSRPDAGLLGERS